MPDESWKTLLHPFEAGHLDMPEASSRVLFIGADPEFRLPEGFSAQLTIVQGFRPAFLELQKRGLDVFPELEGDGYDVALVLAGRHRGQNEAWMREAAARVRDFGLVVVAASKKNGGDSLRRRTAGDVALSGHLSKHHGMVFWFDKPAAPLPEPEDAVAVIDERFRTAPGMFSHGRIDVGSRLLASQLPQNVKGTIADLGAGWGYLSAELVSRKAGDLALHLYEADFASCTAARANLLSVPEGVRVEVFWRDVTAEPLERQYNLMVMNPPFHAAGHGADPALGLAMIEAAAKGLRKGGRLYMVANVALPYERFLAGRFARFEETARDQGFKVLVATR
ncbi:MAG: class I SAM-dependent methyltransferase [Mesorhizobium sp.]|nr:class I SAM-dependent methyltransferase [Mesorhizobium sp.]